MRIALSVRLRGSLQPKSGLRICILLALAVGALGLPESILSARTKAEGAANQQDVARRSRETEEPNATPDHETTEDWNKRLQERLASKNPMPSLDPQDYVIGPEDVLDINVFEAPELNREVRVSANGEISLPLLGAISAAGCTPRELETALEKRLYQTYMKDPHVSVFVRDMQSHPVSVMGAVRKPGIFQIRGSKTLLEILSLAEGLADDAGEDVIILRSADLTRAPGDPTAKAGDLGESSRALPAQESGKPAVMEPGPGKVDDTTQAVVKVNLKDLLDSTDPRTNPAVYPRDIVKVSRAGIVYVVGAVQRPGGFPMKSNDKISVLQAIALSEGLTRTAAKGRARIISTNELSGARTETPINLDKILSGKSFDPVLGARDIVFIPDSATKAAFTRGVDAAAQTVTGLAIFRW